MKVVKVYGALRELLGQCRFELDVVTPSQAVKALCVNFPQLERWLLDSEKHGVAYRVMVGKQKATAEDVSPLLLPFGEREVFSITPVVTGAGGGGGVTSIILGVALVAVSIIVPAATFGLTSMLGVGLVGGSLILGGVAQLLAPTPTVPKFEDSPQSQLESFSFSGIVNTSRQGVPVPIVLGRAYAGSVVISSWTGYSTGLKLMTEIRGSGGGGGGCFTGETLVTVPGGTKAIKDIQVGDIVCSFDDKGKLHEGKVLKVHEHENERVVRYALWGGQSLDATPNHWVLNQYNAFVEIQTLGSDDCLVDEFNHLLPIVSRTEIGAHTVYNLTVEGHHTFIANTIRVHNAGLGLKVVGSGGGGSKGGRGGSSILLFQKKTLITSIDSICSRS